MGRVVDEETNKGLENIVVKSSSTTVIGDLDGNFNIDVESLPVVLNFSTFGYNSKDLNVVQNNKSITVKLQADQIVLARRRLLLLE